MDDESAGELVAELHRELPTGHQLYGRDLLAIARREGRDDVLFRPAGEVAPVYWVHLTWAVERDPTWPWTETYANLDDFLERWPREELDDGFDHDRG